MNEPKSNGHAAPADEINRLGLRVQELMEELNGLGDTPARELAHECVSALVAFYGQGIERMLTVVKRSGIGGQKSYDDLIQDRVVSGLLLIHGLHPVDLRTRLTEALEKIRPYMESHGGNVELLSLENDFAQLRLQGACKTCPSSSVTVELAVRHAIEEACPDLAGFEVEGATPSPAPSPKPAAEWTEIAEAQGLAEGALIRAEAKGASLVICKEAGQLYAYRDRCPACNLPLHLGKLEAGVLSCRAGHRYSAREAGAGLDGSSHLHLDPVPLLGGVGAVRVAVREAHDAGPNDNLAN